MTVPVAVPEGKVWIIPLGGIGRVGNACFLVDYKDTSLVMDCGLDPGVFHEYIENQSVLVAPPSRLDILDQKMVSGREVYAVITHGHLDHCGAVRELLHRGIKNDQNDQIKDDRLKNRLAMSYVTSEFLYRYQNNLGIGFEKGKPLPWTRIDERKRDQLKMQFGDINVHIIPQNHSIFGGFGLLLVAGRRKIVYLSDFKFNGFKKLIPDKDHPGTGSLVEGKTWFEGVLRNVAGQGGVDCLILDVLNSDLEGFTLPEEEVLESLEKTIEEAPARVFISLISSNLQRLEEIIKMVSLRGKKLAVVGRSMRESFEMLQDRLLKWACEYASDTAPDIMQYIPRSSKPPYNYVWGAIYRNDDRGERLRDWLRNFLDLTLYVQSEQDYDKVDVILISGTQGEPNSALVQTLNANNGLGSADKGHLFLRFKKNDWSVISGRVIPGNEENMRTTVCGLAEQCEKVIVHHGETARLALPSGRVEERFAHVSGHGQIEDLARSIEILQPRAIVPVHAPQDRVDLFKAMCATRFPGIEIIELQAGQPLEI